MIKYKTVIKKFSTKGEKSGWTYIEVSLDKAEQLNPSTKKAYRVKGKLDNYDFEGISLTPMGEGNYIMALNKAICKAIKKQPGDTVNVSMEIDQNEKPLSADLLLCLEEEPDALAYFNSLPKSHQRYFSNWIESAKTDSTKTKRIAQSVNALALKIGFAEMIRMNKGNKNME